MRYIKYLIICAIPVLLAGCEKEKPTDEDIFASRVSSKLEVQYAYDGSSVQALSFGHNARQYNIDVNINDPNLRWTLESDRDWLKVVPAEHKGPGSIAVALSANENFEKRDPATLTFVAGEFRGFKISVDQAATAFIVGQPFMVSPMKGISFESKITTKAGASWQFESDGWLKVAKGGTQSSGGMETTTLSISADSNSGASRFGRVTLSSGGEKETVSVFQFGNEYSYSSDGRIKLPGSESSVSIIVPRYLVADVVMPSFAEYTITDTGEDQSTVTITIPENLNDCSEERELEASLKLSNGSASSVQLPGITQGFLPAHGLVTAKGFMAFAAAVAAGESTADWETDGVVTMKGDIDMNEVTEWAGVGTAAKPFKGSFDGGGHAVINLRKAPCGIFNECSGATISNLKLGKGCSIYSAPEYGASFRLGGIVSRAVGTKISNCEAIGNVEFGGSSDGESDDPALYVGAIAGFCDAASSVTNCKVTGKVALTSSSDRSVLARIGGIAGRADGTVSGCIMNGSISLSSGIGSLLVGGITGELPGSANVDGNAFMGTITLGGSACLVELGGLYGRICSSRSFDYATDKSVAQGTIELNTYESGASTMLFAGGFAGKAEPGIDLSFKGFEPQCNFTLDRTADRQLSMVAIGGILGGCEPDEEDGFIKSATFENIANKGNYSPIYAAVTSKLLHSFIGGVAGFVNAKKTVFRGCSNTGVLGKPATSVLNCSNTKNYTQVTGGIAGVVQGGDAEFADCENKGALTNNHYSNVIPGGASGGWWAACGTGGILGAFDYKVESVSGKLTMTNCANSGTILNYRGMSGGIVAYARNAQISNCTNMGDMATTNGNAANKGGIACWLSQSTIKDCVVKCSLFCSNPASAVQSPGGILSISTDGGVSVIGCSFFGVISVNKGDQPYLCGGIVSTAESDTIIKDCRFGGTIMNVEMSENNIASNAVGNGLGNVSGLTYWSGN